MKKSMLSLFVVSFFAVSSYSAGTIPSKFWPVLKAAQAPGVYEDQEHVGIYNRNTGVLFDRKTGNLAGIWDSKGWLAASNINPQAGQICGLWQVETISSGAEKPLVADSRQFSPGNIQTHSDSLGASIKIKFVNVKSGNNEISVELEAALNAEDAKVRWKIAVPNKKKNSFSVWSVSYPIVAIPAFDGGSNSKLVAPYRRGTLAAYGPGSPRYASSYPYPGPAAKFQFLAAYGSFSHKGLYYAAEDGEAYSKVFHVLNEPRYNSVILKVEHLPANRGVAGAGFASPYEVVTEPFKGDWWNAARIYRQWWVKQIWASKGLMQDRKDIPDWLKKSPVCVRFSTTKPQRTIENNLRGGLELSSILNGKPFFGTWYGPFGEKVGQQTAGLEASGHGQILPVSEPVKAALKTMGEHNVYFMSYLQSVIFDSHFPNMSPEDARAADANVSRDAKGNIVYYGKSKDGQYAMCRATEWWQKRFVDMAVNAVKGGFRGIYFDSFGKGEAECFAPGHGHCIGGGNKVIAGQRRMAQRVLEAIHKIDPNAIISGEAPIEAFRDLIYVNLYAVNRYKNYVPIFRTVWGDYSLGHGRNVRAGESAENIIPEMASLFVDGTILGRFFCSGGNIFPEEGDFGTEKRYLQKVANYTTAGIDYLRFGEYLHPLELTVPTIEYKETTENNKVTIPVVLNSVTRSHRDGSVAIVLANVTDKPVKFDLSIDAAWRGEKLRTSTAVLFRMNEKGEQVKIGQGDEVMEQAVRIEPYDIVFYILK